MSRQAHAAAVLAQLAASPGATALVVHDGAVPPVPAAGSSPPYVVARFTFRKLTATEAPDKSTLSYASTAYQVDVRVHSVGSDARNTRGVAYRAERQLLNWTPTVAGYTCTALRQIEAETLEPNEAMGVSVEQQVDVYRFVSVPA